MGGEIPTNLQATEITETSILWTWESDYSCEIEYGPEGGPHDIEFLPIPSLLDFDGTGYVEAPHDEAINITGSISFGCFFTVDTFDDSWQALIGKGNNAYQIRRNSNDNFLCADIRGALEGDNSVQSTSNINDDQEHHVMAVYDQSTLKIYINGVEEGSSNVSGTMDQVLDPFQIGANFDGSEYRRHWKGKVREVRIHNQALTPQEVEDISNGVHVTTGLQLYLPLTEGDGSTAYDHSDNDLHGTVTSLDWDITTGSWDLVPAPAPSFLQDGLDPGSAQEARVRSIIDEVPSEWTEWVQVTTLTEEETLSVTTSTSAVSGPPPLQITFSSHPTGGVPPYSFHWDFGDGNISTEQDPIHTYEEIGHYTVVLTVTDDEGDVTQDTISINVTDLPDLAYGLVGPTVDETWEQHFINNGWDTPQDQIDAGYPYYLQPAADTGSFQKTIDLEAVVDGRLNLILTSQVLTGEPIMQHTVEVSEDGVEWIEFEDALEVYATQYQYIRITVNVDTDEENKGLLALHSIRYRISMVEIFDRGSATADANDEGGTVIEFNKDFIDVHSINVTVKSTDHAIPVVIFEDVPHPESFKVKVFYYDGERITRDISWEAQGV